MKTVWRWISSREPRLDLRRDPARDRALAQISFDVAVGHLRRLREIGFRQFAARGPLRRSFLRVCWLSGRIAAVIVFACSGLLPATQGRRDAGGESGPALTPQVTVRCPRASDPSRQQRCGSWVDCLFGDLPLEHAKSRKRGFS